ncbi:MAG TPA: hypothetical protein VMZ92_10630 [Planctomycetota bacterium]|nr:hypothetical protein [Planctomycetota bacterium]
MPRQPAEYVDLHKAADYFEPLLRVRFIRAMKAIQASVGINALALSIGNPRQAANLVSRDAVVKAMGPVMKVIRDSLRHGGRLGAVRVQRRG